MTYRADGADILRALAQRACEAVGLDYREANHLVLRRGPYVVGAGLDESIAAAPLVVRGRFVDLFDARLPVVEEATFAPGSRRLLLDLDKIPARGPAVLASACKVLGAQVAPDGAFTFHAEGPDRTEAVARIALPGPPVEVKVDGQPLDAAALEWHEPSKTLLIRFPNAAEGRRVEIR